MKRSIMTLALLGSALATPAFAQVGVSVNVGQPGFYGRLDIGNSPAPTLIYQQPVTVFPPAPGIAPIYMRVPPGHAKQWRRYCERYQACGVPVYFVTDGWYQRVYMPRYESHHGDRGYYRGEGYREFRDEHRRGDWDNDRERHGPRGERDHGHGKGHGLDRD